MQPDKISTSPETRWMNRQNLNQQSERKFYYGSIYSGKHFFAISLTLV